MKQKIILLLVLIVLAITLVGLNLASYTQKPKEIDSEANPNRSSFHSGATGTLAFYSLLNESGRKVVRWQESMDGLKTAGKRSPSVLVVIGTLRRDLSEIEETQLLEWVSEGGRLVVIDRYPADAILTSSTDWKIDFASRGTASIFTIDPSDSVAMTKDEPAAKPSQPSVLTAGINAIQPSVLASKIILRRMNSREVRQSRPIGPSSSPPIATNKPPEPRQSPFTKSNTGDGYATNGQPMNGETIGDAPVRHFGTGDQNIVVDVPYGAGQIIFVSDPFIVSNSGIALVDNAAFAINLTSTDGIVAFDEYHQGYGADQNRLFQFFAGTPVVAIFFQFVLLAGFVFYSRSRRFARPVPDAESDRLSKLEYVGAMAELQQRTKAYDLAIENVYREFKSRSTRLLGLNNQTTTVTELAIAIVQRTSIERSEIESALDSCEQIMFGERTNKGQVVELVSKLRDYEAKLGIKRRSQG